MTEENTNDEKFVVFLDTIGRTIIGELIEDSETSIKVSNPAVVNIAPQQVAGPDGQPTQRMALQLFPLFFREFLAAKDEAVVFNFNKDNITMTDGDITLDFKVGIQYKQLFATAGTITTPQDTPTQADGEKDSNIIDLFPEA